jgi:ATP-dependent DNA ligase
MLAQLARELPEGDYLYEPKWDGFRALALRDGATVDIRSRHGRPLARYFPEVVEALRAQPCERFVLDGEILATPFPALMARLHPAASRVERLRAETPAELVAFDLLALDGEELLDAPLADRRARLEALVAPPLLLSPATRDAGVACAWLDEHEGVLAKPLAGSYEPGRRGWVKVKHDRTADCVVAGFRWNARAPTLGSLLLGLYDEQAALVHVGVVTGLAQARKRELHATLAPLVVPIEGHPWERGFGLERSPVGRLLGAAGRWDPAEMALDWVPVAPELVAEVAYTQVDGFRFRHPARLRRWRPDREPRSCTLEQLA